MMRPSICRLSFFLWGLSGLLVCGQSPEEMKLKESVLKDGSRHEKGAVSENGLARIKVGGVEVWVEVAQTPETLEQGLMFREALPENQGMLFVYPYEQILSFWMRNTFMPLDIAFIDRNGVIVSIQQMEPLDEERRYLSPVPVQYALEMNRGWFERNGVRVRDRVEF